MRMNISLPTFASLPGEHRIFGNMFTLTILFISVYCRFTRVPGYQGSDPQRYGNRMAFWKRRSHAHGNGMKWRSLLFWMSLKYKCSMPDSKIHLYQLPDFSVRHQSRFNDVFLIVLYVEDVLIFILCKYNQMNAHIHTLYMHTLTCEWYWVRGVYVWQHQA